MRKFNFYGLLLFIIIMVPNFIWFLVPATNDILRNEIDVMGVFKNNLICISCKDTSSHSIEFLNELFIYANNLGSEESIKILVATHEPKSIIQVRAKELNIHILIFRGDVSSFQQELRRIVSDLSGTMYL